jgi:hypothetical protein
VGAPSRCAQALGPEPGLISVCAPAPPLAAVDATPPPSGSPGGGGALRVCSPSTCLTARKHRAGHPASPS